MLKPLVVYDYVSDSVLFHGEWVESVESIEVDRTGIPKVSI